VCLFSRCCVVGERQGWGLLCRCRGFVLLTPKERWLAGSLGGGRTAENYSPSCWREARGEPLPLFMVVLLTRERRRTLGRIVLGEACKIGRVVEKKCIRRGMVFASGFDAFDACLVAPGGTWSKALIDSRWMKHTHSNKFSRSCSGVATCSSGAPRPREGRQALCDRALCPQLRRSPPSNTHWYRRCSSPVFTFLDWDLGESMMRANERVQAASYPAPFSLKKIFASEREALSGRKYRNGYFLGLKQSVRTTSATYTAGGRFSHEQARGSRETGVTGRRVWPDSRSLPSSLTSCGVVVMERGPRVDSRWYMRGYWLHLFVGWAQSTCWVATAPPSPLFSVPLPRSEMLRSARRAKKSWIDRSSPHTARLFSRGPSPGAGAKTSPSSKTPPNALARRGVPRRNARVPRFGSTGDRARVHARYRICTTWTRARQQDRSTRFDAHTSHQSPLPFRVLVRLRLHVPKREQTPLHGYIERIHTPLPPLPSPALLLLFGPRASATVGRWQARYAAHVTVQGR